MTTLGGGRYELDGLLGRGGMAEVRKAHDARLGRTVAIKRLRTDLASDPTFLARFGREAQAAASLNHPTIVAVYDTGEEAAADGTALPYIVMEYVEGRTLRDILREGRKVLPERALEITCAVLTALDYSHRAGIIHRDIKPANVMLTPSGDVKVMDFGIARAVADSSASITQTAAVIGTAQYLSPEQARGEQVDARSDIYSAGCLLYELLTGRPPFVGESPLSVAYQHVREEAPAPSTLDPEISPEMDAITRKALAKSVDARYQSAVQMRDDIERALGGKEVLAAPLVGASELETQKFLASPPLETSPTTIDPALAGATEFDDPRRSHTGLWAGLLLSLAALVIAGLVVVPKLVSGDGATQRAVPNLFGMTVEKAKRQLEDVGLELGEQTPGTSPSVQPGHVMRQAKEAQTLVDEGSAIDVTVATEPDSVTIPADITDQNIDEATATLEELDLNVVPEPVPKSAERRGQVTSTDPAPGELVKPGSDVTVSYSTGFVEVPSLFGKSQQAAEAELRLRGFKPLASDARSDSPAGTVIDQDIPAGTRKPYGSFVVITVSLGPTTVPTTSSPPPSTSVPPPTTSAPLPSSPTTSTPTTTKPTTTPTTTKPTTTPTTTKPTTTPTTTKPTTTPTTTTPTTAPTTSAPTTTSPPATTPTKTP